MKAKTLIGMAKNRRVSDKAFISALMHYVPGGGDYEPLLYTIALFRPAVIAELDTNVEVVRHTAETLHAQLEQTHLKVAS
jgi:hypothetical protein